MPAPTLDVVAVAPAERGHHIGDINTPIIDPAELIAGLGTYPTLTFPIRRGRPVDVTAVRDFLGAPAEFFGIDLPGAEEFEHVVTAFVAAAFARSPASLVAATITVVGARVVLTGVPGAVFSDIPVRVGHLAHRYRPTNAGDAHWLRMAARTVSRADADQQLRDLWEQGCVDGIPAGPVITAPLAGALVLQTAVGPVGVDTGEPVSILDQLRDCAVLAELPRRAAVPAPETRRAWWIAPQFVTHPIALLGEQALPVDPKPPSFLEQL